MKEIVDLRQSLSGFGVPGGFNRKEKEDGEQEYIEEEFEEDIPEDEDETEDAEEEKKYEQFKK